MPIDDTALGTLIRDLREARGWSQARLARLLCAESGRPTVTRHEVSRWEHGRRDPVEWLPHLASVFDVPLEILEAARVERRQFIINVAATAAMTVMPPPARQTISELVTSIAGGDRTPLAQVQTSHTMDLAIAELAARDRPTLLRLARWAEDDDSDVVRVNATGIIAKTRSDLLERVPLTLTHDADVRHRYVSAVADRIGSAPRSLINELRNPADVGARWCTAYLLRMHDGPQVRAALVAAVRAEPVRENIRSYALILNGEDPCT